MDIHTSLNKKSERRKAWPKWLLLGATFIVAGCALYLQRSATPTVMGSDLDIAVANRGDLAIKIKGYGKLKPRIRHYLTSQDRASIEKIYLRPGARVEKDTLILTLHSPQTEQRVANARLELARQRAQYQEQLLGQQSEMLARQSQITQLDSELETARLRSEAEEKLIGQGIVSALEYRRSRLNVEQLEKRRKIEATRLEQLEQIQQQRLKVQKELLKQVELNYQSAERAVAKLKIRAGIDGVLQSLDVESGQAITPGAELGLVGSDRELKAELKVLQSEAEQVALGMPGVINTFSGTVQGKVTRIDPVVSEGRVLIELALSGPLPKNARPELGVEGFIVGTTLKNVLHIKAPAGVRPNSKRRLYRLEADHKTARLTDIEFGTMSDNRIEILKGLKAGESLIISDLSNWQDIAEIKIQQETL